MDYTAKQKELKNLQKKIKEIEIDSKIVKAKNKLKNLSMTDAERRALWGKDLGAIDTKNKESKKDWIWPFFQRVIVVGFFVFIFFAWYWIERM